MQDIKCRCDEPGGAEKYDEEFGNAVFDAVADLLVKLPKDHNRCTRCHAREIVDSVTAALAGLVVSAGLIDTPDNAEKFAAFVQGRIAVHVENIIKQGAVMGAYRPSDIN